MRFWSVGFGVILLALFFTPFSTAPRGSEQKPRGELFPLDPARAQYLAAIEAAGRSGDRSLIPALQLRLRSETDALATTALRVALARFEDIDQLQILLCQSRYAAMRWGPARLGDVGGWYGIQGILFLMSDRWRAEKQKHTAEFLRADGDVIQWPDEATLVLAALMSVVPNAPPELVVPGHEPNESDSSLPNEEIQLRFERRNSDIDARRDQLNRDWPVWIDAHRAELQLLRPTGEGVDFSVAACDMKKGKPRRKIAEK